jgi:GR25 family glycosyltransferase involved in LPS biosynthesis
MSILNEYFEKIYYINLERRKDRNQECIDELKKYNIIAERFDAVDANLLDRNNWTHSMGNLGCVNSHLNIIKKAKENKYKNILILEDDVVFDVDMEENFKKYYNQVPENWDILYLSGNHNQHEGYTLEMVSENVGRCHLTYTTHSFVVRESMYDTIIDRLSNAKNPVDVEYTTIQKICNSYTFYPGITTQRIGYSDIMCDEIDYTKYIK